MNKKIISTALCLGLTMSAIPMYEMAHPQVAQAAQNDREVFAELINELNASVFESYFGVYRPLNGKIFTNPNLLADMNAKDEYIALNQKGKKIVNKKTGFEIQDVKISGNYARVIAKRIINITINGRVSNGENTEGYLMRKANGEWRIENVFINWNGTSDAFKNFKKTNNFSLFLYDKVPLETTTGINFRNEVKKLKKEPIAPNPAPTPQRKIAVVINGKPLDTKGQPPVLENNRTLVPLRSISESLNAKVTWRAEDQSITIKNNNDVYVFHINKNKYTKNKQPIPLDAACRIVPNTGRTLVPIRAIGEIFGTVRWDPETYTAYVNTAPIQGETQEEETPETPSTPAETKPEKPATGIDISSLNSDSILLIQAFNSSLFDSMKGNFKTLPNTLFATPTLATKVSDAMHRFADQLNGSTLESFDNGYDLIDVTKKGEYTRVIMSYKGNAQVTLANGQKLKTTLMPRKVGLLIKDNPNEDTIAAFLTEETDGSIRMAAFAQATDFTPYL